MNIVWSIPIILLGQKNIMRKPLGIGSLGGPTSHPRLPPPRTDPPHPRGHRSIRRYRQDEFGPTLSSPTAIGRNNSHPFKRRGGHKNDQKNPSQVKREGGTDASTARTILGEVRVFRQEGVRLLDALLDCWWECHGIYLLS